MVAGLIDAQRFLAARRFADAATLCERLLAAGDRNTLELRNVLDLARGAAARGDLDAQGHFNVAIGLQRAGLYSEAADAYREVLRRRPDAAEAYNNLGSVLQALGEQQGAAAAFEQALQLRPDYARALTNLGGLWVQVGRAADARGLLERAVAADGRHAEAWTNLGAAQRALGDLDGAAASCRRAIELRPEFATAHFNLASILRERGDLEGALDACAEARRCDPADAAPQALRAVLLTRAGRGAEASVALGDLARAAPARPDVVIGISRDLRAHGRSAEAEALVARALARAPAHAELRLEHARLCRALRRFDVAVRTLEPLLADGASAAAWSELGYALLGDVADNGSRLPAAIEAFGQAITLEPERHVARLELALALIVAERGNEAVAHLERVLADDPGSGRAAAALLDLRAAQGDWRDFHALRAVMRAAIERGPAYLNPLQVALRFDDLELLQRAARQLIAGLDLDVPPPRAARPRRGPRLRVGYLSQDFHNHPVAHAMAPVLEHHDRSRFEIVGIAIQGDDGSEAGRRVRGACERLVDAAALGAPALQERLRELELDVLVDLGGFTAAGRPRALAQRPAPIQVSYLGYPVTTGSAHMDYVIGDRFLIPADATQWYDEAVVWLPDTFLPGERPGPAAPPSRAAEGLPAEAFVFCNFNQPSRLGPDAFDSFLRVLARVPGSVLWLRDPGPEGAAHFRARAVAGGVASERLIFAGYAARREQHVARVALADLFLDSLPYNAHTTARDALGVGVPVLTRAGASFAARVAGSLLTSLGLQELITFEPDAFEARAVELAASRVALDSLRGRLRAGVERSSAFNPARQARQLEAAYAAMHERSVAGLPASSMVVSLP